jgi:hypothetical protein
VRAVTSWTLIALIVSCPLFCATDECDSRAHHALPADGPATNPPAPDSCLGDAGNCVCEGAILGLISRGHDVDSSTPPLPCDWSRDAAGPGLLIHRRHLSHRGRLGDPIAPDDALSVRARLQDFRC